MKKNKRIYAVLFVFCLFFTNFSYPLVFAADDVWTTLQPMQQARAGLGVAEVNGKIYAIGGSTASGVYPPDLFEGKFVGTNEEYDPELNIWIYRTPMLTPRAYFAVATYENKIYCVGGAIDFSVDERSGFHSYIPSAVNEVYDTVTNTWETKKPLPFPQMDLQAQVLNNKIYAIGGAFTYVYDPEADSWGIKEKAPVSHPWPVVVDNQLIVSGEYSQLYGSPVEKILFYDPDSDSWNEGKSNPTAVVQGSAGATTGVLAPKKVYLLGLLVETPFPTVITQVYDLQSEIWTTASVMQTNRSQFGVVVVNDILYAIGGYLRSSSHLTPLALNEQYTPIDYIPEFPSWTILPLFLVATLSAMLINKRLSR